MKKSAFKIEIFKGSKSGVTLLDADNIGWEDSFKEDILHYNDIFSELIAKNSEHLHYLLSPTLTRIEGVTLFYDKVYKFKYFLDFINKSTDNIRIINLDYKTAKALIYYLRKNGETFKYSSFKLLLEDVRRNFMFLLRLLILPSLELLYILFSRLLLKVPKFKAYDYAIYSYYDYRSYTDGKYKEEYLRTFPEYILSQGKKLIVFVKPLHFNSLRIFLRYISFLAKTDEPYEVLPYQLFVTPTFILKALIRGLTGRVKIREKIIFKGIDISYLTSLSIKEDLQRMWCFHNYLEYYFSYKILKDYSIGSILYPYENHPWEKALIFARNELGVSTRLVGFQHTSFSFKLLNHFPGRYEKDLAIHPDNLFTAGGILKEIFLEYGNFPEGRVQEGCALRHPYLFEDFSPPQKTSFTKKIAYAFSFDVTNYEIIINNLIRIFGDTEFTIYLKLHPDALGGGFRPKSRLPENFILAIDIPWKKLFEEIDILLYDDNSLCIEALRYNIRVGYFSLTGQTYNTDRLFKYEGRKISAHTVEGFREAIDDYYKGSTDTLKKDYIYNQNYLERYFTPITEERMKRFLE